MTPAKIALASLAAFNEPAPSPKPVTAWLQGNKTIQATISQVTQGTRRPDIHVIKLSNVVVTSILATNELGLHVWLPTPDVPTIDVALAVGKFLRLHLLRNLGLPIHHTLNDDETTWWLERFIGKRVEIEATTRNMKHKPDVEYTNFETKLLDPSPFDDEGQLIDPTGVPPPPTRDRSKLAMEIMRVMRGERVDSPNTPVQPLVLKEDGTPTECVICGRCYCDHPRQS